jgi:hypothetical protein
MSLLDSPGEKATPAPSSETPLKKLLPFTSVALIIAALYVAWTFYSRHASDRAAAEQIAAHQQEARQRVVDQVFGDGAVKFVAFGADSAVLKRGESTQLCYGVVNAKTVTMDPPVEALKPSYRHCLQIAPSKTTTYTVAADDGKGHKQSESVTIHVR